MKKSKGAWEDIANMKNIDQMFDLSIAGAYLAAQFGLKIPVQEARNVFENIKKLHKGGSSQASTPNN